MELTRYHGSLNLESFGSLFVIQRRKKHLPRLNRSASEHKQFSLLNSQQSLSLGPDKFSVFQLKKQTSQKKKKMCYPSSCLHVTCLLHKSYRLTNCLQAKWLHRFCIQFLLKKTNVELSSNYCSGCWKLNFKAVNYPPDFDDSLYLFWELWLGWEFMSLSAKSLLIS